MLVGCGLGGTGGTDASGPKIACRLLLCLIKTAMMNTQTVMKRRPTMPEIDVTKP